MKAAGYPKLCVCTCICGGERRRLHPPRPPSGFRFLAHLSDQSTKTGPDRKMTVNGGDRPTTTASPPHHHRRPIRLLRKPFAKIEFARRLAKPQPKKGKFQAKEVKNPYFFWPQVDREKVFAASWLAWWPLPHRNQSFGFEPDTDGTIICLI